MLLTKPLCYYAAQALVTSPLELDAALKQSQERLARSVGGGASALGNVARTLGASLSLYEHFTGFTSTKVQILTVSYEPARRRQFVSIRVAASVGRKGGGGGGWIE